MTQKLLEVARNDHRVATALHEAGHAVAYLGIGRDFKYLSAGEYQIVDNGEPIDQWDQAVTAMAGPAVEAMMYHYGRGAGDTEIYGWIIGQMQEWQEFGEVEGDAERSDYTDAGPSAVAALPLALAIVTSRWEDIERIATAALDVERLTYGEVRRLAPGQVEIGNESARWLACSQQHEGVTDLLGR